MTNPWIQLSKAIGCGGCSRTTTIESPYTCNHCGRMLCGHCGEFCSDHTPLTKHAANLPCTCTQLVEFGIVNPDCKRHGPLQWANR